MTFGRQGKQHVIYICDSDIILLECDKNYVSTINKHSPMSCLRLVCVIKRNRSSTLNHSYYPKLNCSALI